MEASRLHIQLQQEHDRLFGGTSVSSPYYDAEIVNPRRMLQGKENNKKDDEGEDSKEEKEEEETTSTSATSSSSGSSTSTSASATGVVVGETRIDLVKLIPFDVKLSLWSEGGPLNTFALTDIISEWMEESIGDQLVRMELESTHSIFDSVILEERGLTQQPVLLEEDTSASTTTTTKTSALLHYDEGGGRQRNLQQQQQTTTTTATQTGTGVAATAANTNMIASYEGVTLWKHTTNSNMQIMTPTLLEDIERQALLQDEALLIKLQGSPAEGLGDQVQDVKAYINPNPTNYIPISNGDGAAANSGPANAKNLELIIVVAIVVACMAFAFLVFSLFWAWRFDQQKRDAAYRVDSHNNPNSPVGAATGASSKTSKKRNSRSTDAIEDSEEEQEPRTSPSNMNVLINNNGINNNQDDDTTLNYPTSETNPTTGVYPESVISEDISTSLSAYYRSGMGSRPLYGGSSRTGGLGGSGTNGDFNDQASFSSMESYGYSLDGYAPSLGGNTYTNNGGGGATASGRPPSDAGGGGADEK